MLVPSNEHKEFVKMAKEFNPKEKEKINQNDDWYFKETKHVSNSMLKVFQKNGIKSYDCYLNGELKKESEAFKFGSAFHTLVLEPEEFAERYYIFDDTDKCIEISGEDWKEKNKKPRNTKAYKEWYQEVIEESKNKIIVSSDDMEKMNAMIESMSKIKEIEVLLQAIDEVETIYTGNLCGLPVKCKVDGWKFSDFIIDLKTTDCVGNFDYACHKYDYDQAAAFYSDIMKVDKFVFIVVEKEYPYNVGVFTAGESFLERGRNKYESGLKDLKTYLDNKDYNVNKFYFRKELN